MCYSIIKERENTKERRKEMNRQEIEARIEALENKDFILQMKDRWNERDEEEHRNNRREIRELKEMIKE